MSNHNYQSEIPNKIRWQIEAAKFRIRELPGPENRRERARLQRMARSKERLLAQVLKQQGVRES